MHTADTQQTHRKLDKEETVLMLVRCLTRRRCWLEEIGRRSDKEIKEKV